MSCMWGVMHVQHHVLCVQHVLWCVVDHVWQRWSVSWVWSLCHACEVRHACSIIHVHDVLCGMSQGSGKHGVALVNHMYSIMGVV